MTEPHTLMERVAALEAHVAVLNYALNNVRKSLVRAGATLPAREPDGTIEGAMNNGLCIALCVVDDAIRSADAMLAERTK